MSGSTSPKTMSEGVRAIVAGHGEFAAGLISAVAQISGQGEQFVGLSNRDLSAQDVERELRARLSPEVGVIFTDLPAGSCTMAARRVQRERPELIVVTGTNLATLLDFVFHLDVPAGEAARHAVDKGRASLAISGAPGGH